jgi:hypothetical protein
MNTKNSSTAPKAAWKSSGSETKVSKNQTISPIPMSSLRKSSDLEAALEQFREIAVDLVAGVSTEE